MKKISIERITGRLGALALGTCTRTGILDMLRVSPLSKDDSARLPWSAEEAEQHVNDRLLMSQLLINRRQYIQVISNRVEVLSVPRVDTAQGAIRSATRGRSSTDKRNIEDTVKLASSRSLFCGGCSCIIFPLMIHNSINLKSTWILQGVMDDSNPLLACNRTY
jgi:hypothetical protein